MTEHPETPPPDAFELAKLHLDRFWHEIFWRRENEQKVAVWSVGLFGAVLALAYNSERDFTPGQLKILASFPLLLAAVSAWYLFQNWQKDKVIARMIVRLNIWLGAWQEGCPIPGQRLYPNDWAKWGIDPDLGLSKQIAKFVKDPVSFLYFLVVFVSGALCAYGILQLN